MSAGVSDNSLYRWQLIQNAAGWLLTLTNNDQQITCMEASLHSDSSIMFRINNMVLFLNLQTIDSVSLIVSHLTAVTAKHIPSYELNIIDAYSESLKDLCYNPKLEICWRVC